MNEEKARKSEIIRETGETKIKVVLALDGSRQCSIATGLPFFDHMLEQFCFHSGFDLTVEAAGDLEVDCHHLTEDVGIAMGMALNKCLGSKKGIKRYGTVHLPMDECLCMVAADICGRSNLVYNCSFTGSRVGALDVEAVEEFFKALVYNSFITLHINLLYGSNTHHKVECIFKAAARALGEAARLTQDGGIPSTKGCL